MENSYLQRQVFNMKKALFEQGFVDEQFNQLEELQDEMNPNFVEEVVTLYFKDSSKLIVNIQSALEKNPRDLDQLDAYMHQFKGSSSSIGALRIKNECTVFKEYCHRGNLEGVMKSFEKVKKEHAILRKKLETYFQVQSMVNTSQRGSQHELVRQAGPVECATRPK